MTSDFAALGQAFLSWAWSMFSLPVPGFQDFTFGELYIGIALIGVSITVARIFFGVGGGGGDRPRTSSTNKPKISKDRLHDEF